MSIGLYFEFLFSVFPKNNRSVIIREVTMRSYFFLDVFPNLLSDIVKGKILF